MRSSCSTAPQLLAQVHLRCAETGMLDGSCTTRLPQHRPIDAERSSKAHADASQRFKTHTYLNNVTAGMSPAR